ncbi:MAG TPA: hypothetical protein VFJ72_00485 [Rubrobacteraceae bacterium]|nr:hypothetical protein [Rubrobacteraceae bacterium]
MAAGHSRLEDHLRVAVIQALPVINNGQSPVAATAQDRGDVNAASSGVAGVPEQLHQRVFHGGDT